MSESQWTRELQDMSCLKACSHVWSLTAKTGSKQFVAKGEQIKDLGEKTIPVKTHASVHTCIAFRSASVVKHFISMRKKSSELETLWCCMKRNRTFQILDMEQCAQWTCVDSSCSNRFSLQLAGTVSGQTALNKLVSPAAACRGRG